MTAAIRPRRSLLYMPGSNARALEKARSLPADGLILDLEDAVAPDAKETARAQVCEAVEARGFGKREVVIRINGLSTAWGEADLAAAKDAKPDAILVPKVSSAGELAEIETRLGDADVAVWAMVETPLAILNIAQIAAAGGRLACFVMGTNDLIKEFRAKQTEDRQNLTAALGLSVAAARAYGLAVIDGVYNDIKNADGFAECLCPGPGLRLRRQDVDPPQPDRPLQRDLRALAGGGGGCTQDHRRLRTAREPEQGRYRAGGTHGRAAACRDRAPDRGAGRRHRGTGDGLTMSAKTNSGNFFEDFRIGQELIHATPRTLTTGDAALYTALYGSRFALQSGDAFAQALGYPRAPLDDLLVFHTVFGKTVPDISLNAVANLGYAEGRFLKPVYPGATLTAKSQVIGLKENSNRKTGVVYVRTEGYRRDGRAGALLCALGHGQQARCGGGCGRRRSCRS